jgi:hypothetical protein
VSVVRCHHPTNALLSTFFKNNIVGKFNKCTVSVMTCVPQKKDDGSYPILPREKLVP